MPRRRTTTEKPETSKRTPRTPEAAKPASTRRRKPVQRAAAITPEERQALVARAAYLRAQARGFAPGYEVEDWLAAEAEVDAQLKRKA